MARIKNQHQESHQRETILINVYFFSSKIGKAKKVKRVRKITCLYVSEICTEGIFVTFPCLLKNVKSRSKKPFFQMSAILKFDFQKENNYVFSEVNDLNYTHTHTHTHQRPDCACDNYIFPKTRGNKNKKWTHSIPVRQPSIVPV